MTEAYDQVVAALPRLSPDERARVVERLKAAQSLSPGGPVAPGPAAARGEPAGGEALEAIAAAVLRLSGERAQPAALRRSSQFPAFAVKAEALGRFLAQHAPARAQRRALLAVGVELLYRDLARAGMSVTSRTLMSCLHQVPGVLDKYFPGYARAGALGMIVGQVGNQREEEVHGQATRE